MPPTTPSERLPSEEERRKFLAEAEHAKAEARKSKAEAAIVEIALHDARRQEKRHLASDQYHHVYRLLGSIGSSSVLECISQLAIWERTEPGCEIELIISSPGGSVVDGMALWDYLLELRQSGHHLTTKARGTAASMAGILLQAGDTRIMGAESWLLIHEAAFGAIGKIGEIEDTVEWVKHIQDRILDIFAARSKLTKKQIQARWRRKDWWLSSADALQLGFIDEIG